MEGFDPTILALLGAGGGGGLGGGMTPDAIQKAMAQDDAERQSRYLTNLGLGLMSARGGNLLSAFGQAGMQANQMAGQDEGRATKRLLATAQLQGMANKSQLQTRQIANRVSALKARYPNVADEQLQAAASDEKWREILDPKMESIFDEATGNEVKGYRNPFDGSFIREGGVKKPAEKGGYTLSPGAKRFDENGNVVASVPESPKEPNRETWRLASPDEIATAGLPKGTVAQVSADGKIQIVNKTENTGATRQQIIAYNKKDAQLKNIENALKMYETELDKTGPSVGASMGLNRGEAVSRLQTSHTNLMIELKNLFELGALSGPDYKLMTDTVESPTTSTAMLRGAKGLKGQLDIVHSMINSARNVAKAQYGIEDGTDLAAGAGAAPTVGASGRPRATNPQTGEAVEFDGSKWVPVAAPQVNQ